MNNIKLFFEQEKKEAGWRFWLFWVLMTNAGFFTGLQLGNIIAALLKPMINQHSFKQVESVIIGSVFAIFVGILQGIVINRHNRNGVQWAIATGVGWGIGTYLAGLLIFSLNRSIETSDFLRWVLPVGFLAGAVLGIIQVISIKSIRIDFGWKWILISSIAWGVFFPGAISGYYINRQIQNNIEDDRKSTQ